MNTISGSKAVLELKLYNYIANNNSIKFMSLVDDYLLNKDKYNIKYDYFDTLTTTVTYLRYDMFYYILKSFNIQYKKSNINLQKLYLLYIESLYNLKVIPSYKEMLCVYSPYNLDDNINDFNKYFKQRNFNIEKSISKRLLENI